MSADEKLSITEDGSKLVTDEIQQIPENEAGESSSGLRGLTGNKRTSNPLKLRGHGKKKKRQPGDPDPRDLTPRRPFTEIVRENDVFERYYSGNGVLAPEELPTFFTVLRDSLPTSFRITL